LARRFWVSQIGLGRSFADANANSRARNVDVLPGLACRDPLLPKRLPGENDINRLTLKKLGLDEVRRAPPNRDTMTGRFLEVRNDLLFEEGTRGSDREHSEFGGIYG
jgi:hypothetical protein